MRIEDAFCNIRDLKTTIVNLDDGVLYGDVTLGTIFNATMLREKSIRAT